VRVTILIVELGPTPSFRLPDRAAAW